MRGSHPERALESAVAERVAARRGEVLLAAVSGGPDSVALAGLLERCAAAAGARLVLGHVNHALRAAAWQDEAVALAAGSLLGARVLCAGLPEGPAGEARLRDERYALLAAFARSCGAGRIFTAHHAQDQTETVLLALLRGAGPDGLCGMPPERPIGDGLRLVRPLLGVDRGALRAYALARRLPYALDASNADRAYRRNALRRVLAELRPDFPGLDEAVARCASILRQEREAEPRAELRRRLRESLRSADGGLEGLTFERLDAAARAAERGRPGRVFLRRGLEIGIRRAARPPGDA